MSLIAVSLKQVLRDREKHWETNHLATIRQQQVNLSPELHKSRKSNMERQAAVIPDIAKVTVLHHTT